MTQTLTFQEYVIEELKEEDKNSTYEYDDYSYGSSDIDYTIQEWLYCIKNKEYNCILYTNSKNIKNKTVLFYSLYKP